MEPTAPGSMNPPTIPIEPEKGFAIAREITKRALMRIAAERKDKDSPSAMAEASVFGSDPLPEYNVSGNVSIVAVAGYLITGQLLFDQPAALLQFDASGIGLAAIVGFWPICYGNFVVDPLTLMEGPYHAQAILRIFASAIEIDGVGVQVLTLQFYGTQHEDYLGNLSVALPTTVGAALLEALPTFKALTPLPPPQPPPGWTSLDSSLKQVSVAQDGTVWGVNANDAVYRYRGDGYSGSGSKWEPISAGESYLTQISVGSATKIWGVNNKGAIYRYRGDAYQGDSKWENIKGSLVCVSVASDGTVWGVNKNDSIYRYRGDSYSGDSKWEPISPGESSLSQISVGSATRIWGVNNKGAIYRYRGDAYQGDKWENIKGSLVYVSVASDGTVWGVNANYNFYRYLGDGATGDSKWQGYAGELSQISVGSSTKIWGIGYFDNICRYKGSA